MMFFLFVWLSGKWLVNPCKEFCVCPTCCSESICPTEQFSFLYSSFYMVFHYSPSIKCDSCHSFRNTKGRIKATGAIKDSKAFHQHKVALVDGREPSHTCLSFITNNYTTLLNFEICQSF